MTATLTLAQQLIAQPSVTPEDAHCQEILIQRLQAMAFHIEQLPFDNVSNFYARRGTQEPVLLFAGHTDVVPPGPIEQWTSPPFTPTVRNNRLYGRGAADMKSSLAAMICACENFLAIYPNHNGSIAFLITSDEEGTALNGTRQVVDILLKRQEKIAWCIIGEASSEKIFGDVVKIGRRGSLNGKLTIYGQQGHIAYPDKALNPIHHSFQALEQLTRTRWDNGNDYFPATSFQISNLHAGTGATNVIPGHLEATFNLRFSPEISAKKIKQKITQILSSYALNYEIVWHLSGEPFLSKKGLLFNAACQALTAISAITPRACTGGGTSDGRFIIKTGCELLELGPINQSIHQIDEYIDVSDLEQLTCVYAKILENLLI